MPEYSKFVNNLVKITLGEHNAYSQYQEDDPILCQQIKKYWTGIGLGFESCSQAWSAVFVSWCIKKAGATADEFKFASAHSQFVHRAIQNTDAGAGVFQGRNIKAYKPKVGDIIHWNREGNRYDFEYARKNSGYFSHSAIVVQIDKGIFGRYAITIGGNEHDSIRKSKIRLDKNGFINQRKHNPYISIVETLK